MLSYEITNYKVSLKTSLLFLDIVTKVLNSQSISVKRYNNFISFHHRFTFIVFKHSVSLENHINITKIKTQEAIQEALLLFCDLIKCSVSSFKIDNIIATTKLNKTLDLKKFSNINADTFKIKYNSEKFPGLFCKFTLGTLIFFHSGKIVIVGCKSIEDIEWLIKQALVLTSTK